MTELLRRDKARRCVKLKGIFVVHRSVHIPIAARATACPIAKGVDGLLDKAQVIQTVGACPPHV